MCMIYNKNNVPSYVRACHRTGRPGTHIAIDDAVWLPSGHLMLSGGRQTMGGKKRTSDLRVYFEIGHVEGGAETIADMARRAQGIGEGPFVVGERVYAVLTGRWVDDPELAKRAATFGWRPVSWVEGLPAPVYQPESERHMAPARRRGRPVQWGVDIVVPAAVTNEELDTYAASIQPSVRWHISNIEEFIKVEVDRQAETRALSTVHSAIRILGMFRDKGWTQEELAELWSDAYIRGWRKWQPSDCPPPKEPPPLTEAEKERCRLLWEDLQRR